MINESERQSINYLEILLIFDVEVRNTLWFMLVLLTLFYKCFLYYIPDSFKHIPIL